MQAWRMAWPGMRHYVDAFTQYRPQRARLLPLVFPASNFIIGAFPELQECLVITTHKATRLPVDAVKITAVRGNFRGERASRIDSM
jgi:hypothetical protein